MIGTTGAAVLFLINVLLACVLGIVAGGVTCLALRQSWSLKEALVTAIDIARGVWKSRVALMLLIAVGSVVARHLIRLVLRSSK
jgi:hypothetical protein